MANETEYIVLEKYKTFTQHVTKYAGIPLYVSCIYGTIMNIIIFGQRIYRHRSSTLYLLVASICDFIHLNLGPLTNLLQYGFDYDWTITSIPFCKTKNYFVFVITAISATLTSLANINQYILSSKKNKRWKRTTKTIAIRLIIWITCSWFVISIPIAICYTRYYHSSANEQFICSNPLHGTFCFCVQIIYICLFNGFLHPLLMIFFGIRTYQNIRRIRRRSLLKSTPVRQMNYQMTLMLILQSIKSSFSSLPFAIFNCYLLITIRNRKSLFYQAKENLLSQLVYFLFWSNYTSFLVYIFSSKIFKNQWQITMKKLCCCLFRRKHQLTDYQIPLKKINLEHTHR